MDGKNCTCSAYSESECCCGVDWTSAQTVKEARRQALLDFADIYHIGSSGWTPKTMRELAKSDGFMSGWV